MFPNNSAVISAEVILKTATGRSLAREAAPVTQENVQDFLPSPETVSKATERLSGLGLTVSHSGPTLTISGLPSQFERIFHVKLTVERASGGMTTVRPQGDLQVPESLRDVIEAVVFPEPPQFFT